MEWIYRRLSLADLYGVSTASVTSMISNFGQCSGTRLRDEVQYREFIAAAFYHRCIGINKFVSVDVCVIMKL